MARNKMLNRAVAGSAVEDTETRLVSALARGVSVLRCFTPTRQELSAREIMDLTGLSKPTLFRLIETLCELGLLRYSQRISKYVAGLGLLNLAAPALARMTVRQLARPLMQELANHIDGQVQLAVGHQDNLTFVELVQGTNSKVFRPEIGVRLSLPRTASGRAYLLSIPQDERLGYLAALEARDLTRKVWLMDRLADAQRDLDQHGFCRGHGDLHREIASIATPMQPLRDAECWIFSAAMPVFSPQSKQLVEDVGPRLITLVRNIEASLGGAS